LLLCYFVTLLLCYFVTLLLCYFVTTHHSESSPWFSRNNLHLSLASPLSKLPNGEGAQSVKSEKHLAPHRFYTTDSYLT
ncbi:MAG: hypothetical protein WAS35_09495, partial [Lactococcus raffinolactis]|jgi:hypothetical protein